MVEERENPPKPPRSPGPSVEVGQEPRREESQFTVAQIGTVDKEICAPIQQVEFDANLTRNSSYSNLDAEKILHQMGKYGRFQMFVYAMSCLGSLMYACETMIMSLIANAPDFECRLSAIGVMNKSLKVVDQCTVMDSISGQSWECGRGQESYFYYNNTDGHTTLASEFDLVCSQEYWTQHGTSLFMIGGMVTTPFVIQLADRYGRRFTFLIPFWLTVVSNIACSLAPSYFYFLIFRFFAGLGTAGIGTVGYVIMIEGVAPAFRSIAPLFSSFVWVGGYMGVGLLHLFIPNWRWLYFAISAPGLLSFSFYWYLPESLHWLITNNKTKQVTRYIKNSSRMNKIEIVLHECRSSHAIERELARNARDAKRHNSALVESGALGLAEVTREKSENRAMSLCEKEKGGSAQNERSRNFSDMFRSRALLFHLILHCFIMITMNFTYWALSLFSVDLHEDEMVGYFMSGAVEVPAGFLSLALLVYFGRRTVNFFALFAQAVAMFAAVVFPGKSWLNMAFPLLAKVFNSVAWTSEPLILGEMSPTSLRNTFFGSVSFAGEIGSVLAPYLNILRDFHSSAPALTICLLSVVAAVAALCSPETKERPMPQDLEDFDPGPVYKFFFFSHRQKTQANVALGQPSLRNQESEKLMDNNKIEENTASTHPKSNEHSQDKAVDSRAESDHSQSAAVDRKSESAIAATISDNNKEIIVRNVKE